ncbi:MAG TPA: tRNA lysidine(34) synthetase TilS [Thermoleophilaceae bacterium]|nr:tRNA lysidine(34) synthetase TilS [Thermoleophilaceae bacterium]
MQERAFEVARASGLIRSGEPLIVLLSGGADSVCLLDCAQRLGAAVHALHVNYGLRPGSDADEQFCRVLCDRMGVGVAVEKVTLGEGNLQAQARQARYEIAERLAAEHACDFAAAHTASDQAETVLYRLAVSPGSRALLGMAPRRGRLVRPLLEASRDDTREYCRQHGLNWRDDPTNEDPRFARSRLRHEVLPVLRALSPAAEHTIAETSFLLRDERVVLERTADAVIAQLGIPTPLEALRLEPAGLARTVLIRLAERTAGPGSVALSRSDCDAVLNLSVEGTQSLDLGGGLRAVAEYGALRFQVGEATVEAPPPAITLEIPGEVEFGDWEVHARMERVAQAAGGGFLPARGDALLSPGAIDAPLTIRPWQHGDRMRPAGLDGTKTLQDVFTDNKVPREERDRIPVVESGGEIVWVAGLAIGEEFRAAPYESEVLVLSAKRRA